MSSKKWLVVFVISCLLITGGITGLNIVVDPFGAWGDSFLQWPSYDFTKNPRVAKIAFMDDHYQEYDSFIVGSSATSSLPVEQLNHYMNAKFYNLFMYGADMYDVKQTATYIIENYQVKNLVLNLSIINAINYQYESDPLTDNLHYKTDKSSSFKFWNKYLFANPNYAFEKLESLKKDAYLPAVYDVFDANTGAYDKTKRDIEPIQDMASYLEKYPAFVNYPSKDRNLNYSEQFLEDVAQIKTLCDSNGINLTVVFFPMYYEHSRGFDLEKVTRIYTGLAEITNFWDFSVSSLTTDARFYYDTTHFRNAMGTMALAKMFGDTDVYYPEDYGVYVTKENAKEQAQTFAATYVFDDQGYTQKVPVIMYHHLEKESNSQNILSAALFEAQIKALSEAGYSSVSLEQLQDYVNKGIDLPEKSVVITFDDGYLSNYEIAYPILKKYNMKATIFIIGVSVGKDVYKDTDNPIIPHFTIAQAKEMVDSGLIEIQSHTYDMHQWGPFESGVPRESVLPLEDEKESDYVNALKTDMDLSAAQILEGTGRKVFALAYPLGKYSDLSEAVLKEKGIEITFTSDPGTNVLIKGLPQCLRAMKRVTSTADVSPEALLELINQ